MRPSDDTAANETQPLVGRAVERERLVALVAREPVVAVVGAAGIGKSALVRACWPTAPVVSLAQAGDDEALAACVAAWVGGAAPIVVWDDVPEALAARVAERARGWSGGRLVLISRVALAALPTVEVGPLSDADGRALLRWLEGGWTLEARIVAGGNPAQIARRLAAAQAAVEATTAQPATAATARSATAATAQSAAGTATTQAATATAATRRAQATTATAATRRAQATTATAATRRAQATTATATTARAATPTAPATRASAQAATTATPATRAAAPAATPTTTRAATPAARATPTAPAATPATRATPMPESTAAAATAKAPALPDAAPPPPAPRPAAEQRALDALCAGRFADALDGDPLVAAAALCALDALDRAAALIHVHADHPRAALLELALAWRRGELRYCVERGEPLLASLDHGGDGLGHAIVAAIVARAAFGLGDIARAEALLRAVDGFVGAGGAAALGPFADLGRVLVSAFRGDWDEARRRVARAVSAAPASALCAAERWWAAGVEPPVGLDGAAGALFDLRAAERALGDGRLDDANRHARDAERFWRDAGAAYDRALALLARSEALARAGERATAAKLRQACAALADGAGYRIVGTAVALVDAYAADRDGDLPAYVAALARARARAGDQLCGRALADACARVGLRRPSAVADGQPMRDRVARLGLARSADLLCSVGGELRLLADDDPPPAADAHVHLDEGTLTSGRREQSMAPQLLLLLEAMVEAGADGITPEALYLAVWNGSDAYHALRHRNAVYVAVNRLRAALEPIAGKDAVRSTSTHYALAPGLRIAIWRSVRRLDVAGFRGRTSDGLDPQAYARRHRLPLSQARWELALHAAEQG